MKLEKLKLKKKKVLNIPATENALQNEDISKFQWLSREMDFYLLVVVVIAENAVPCCCESIRPTFYDRILLKEM